jgi:hypothetical protein
MDKEKVYRLTAERIAENDEQAVRELVRRNARLNDEVIWLTDELEHLRALLNSIPEVRDCSPGREVNNSIKPIIQIELLKFKDSIHNIDRSLTQGYIDETAAHTQRNHLASIYAEHIASLTQREDTGYGKD